MELYEFIFLILGIISLLDFILTSIIIHTNKELNIIFGVRTEVIIRRYIEIVVIIITISIFIYKFLFK